VLFLADYANKNGFNLGELIDEMREIRQEGIDEDIARQQEQYNDSPEAVNRRAAFYREFPPGSNPTTADYERHGVPFVGDGNIDLTKPLTDELLDDGERRPISTTRAPTVITPIENVEDLAHELEAVEAGEHVGELPPAAGDAVQKVIDRFDGEIVTGCTLCDYHREGYCMEWKNLIPADWVDKGCDKLQRDGAPF